MPRSGLRATLQSLRGRLARGELLPWRLSHLGGPYNTLLGVHLRRVRLRREVQTQEGDLPDDTTVVIGHRNRADYRLRNAIQSLKRQENPGGSVRILLVDYGSEPGQQSELRAIARDLAVELLTPSPRREWNRSHCLNIGIRHAATKYVLLSDVDVIFGPTYVAEAVRALREDPLAVVYSPCLHLPESSSPELEAAARRQGWLDPEPLRALGVIRTAGEFSTGMVMTRRRFLERVRGLDEFYHTWGVEDVDLSRRLLWLGLRPMSLRQKSYYLHQWHPRQEGIPPEIVESAKARNTDHFERAVVIRRNPAGWGEG